MEGQLDELQGAHENEERRVSRMPDFIVIGAMKCATSTLHEQLARQRGVFMSTPKEPNFFSDDEVFAQGKTWYQSLFAGAPADAICGESSTHYTKLPTHPSTVERLAKAAPGVKLIYVMRHPIDRLVSHYVHAWSKGEVSCSIDEAVERMPALVDYGRYAMQIAAYVERFGWANVMPVFFGRLHGSPQEELERIAAFIGLRGAVHWDEAIEGQNRSSERMRESRVRDFVLGLPGSRAIRRAVMPQGVRDRIKGAWRMKSRPELSVDVRRRLEATFDEDLGRLGAWLGVDLRCETFDEVTGCGALEWKEAAATAA
jgi:hypothetical protein